MENLKTIGIIGLGMIGGSICVDLKRKHIFEKVIGYSRNIQTMKKALKMGIIDQFCENPEEIIRGVDFLILSTPINVIEGYLILINKIRPDIFFTDVASVKEIVCKKVDEIIGKKSNFIGSHPISGSEKKGIDSIKEGLFENKLVVITPTKNTKKNVKEIVKKFWEKLGSRVIEMEPKKHDKILGFTSHLPHFLVYVLLYVGEKNKKILDGCFGSGFLDTTRIGKSNPEMWIDIFFANKKNLTKWIEIFERELKIFKKFLNDDKINELFEALNKSKLFREGIE